MVISSLFNSIEKKRCPRCNSIFVCWNWTHAFGGDRKAYEQANSHVSPENLFDWSHECWNCDFIFETKHKVIGIPYWLLKIIK